MKNSRNNSHRNSTRKLGPHNRNEVEPSKIWITSISPHTGKTKCQSSITASEAPQRSGLTLMLILTVGFLKVNKWRLIPFASETLTKGEKWGRQAIAQIWTAQTHSKGKLFMQRKNPETAQNRWLPQKQWLWKDCSSQKFCFIQNSYELPGHTSEAKNPSW